MTMAVHRRGWLPALLLNAVVALCCERRSVSDATATSSASTVTPDDVRYGFHVVGDPAGYEPGEHYTISLRGFENDSERFVFYGFTLWAEAEDGQQQTNESRGIFQAYDSQSKPHPTCPSALVNSTGHAKTEIQAMWSAPMDGSACVVLAARLTDDPRGPADTVTLEHRICPAEAKIYGSQPPIINPCCACDEAKYEVTFEGLWSRNTHPKDFPADERITRFSDVIGASHTVHYRFWEVGRVASQGLRELAEEGHTTTLEKELKAESDNIRTIIKARGMSWPRLGGATFAVFRVDAKRHLVSLVSRLSPSPDWVVGVSALELCRANCTWLEADTIDLFPYDAGTDSGITYMSRRQRTIPPGPVRALRPDWPRDPRSPFYDLSGAAMKPFARMRLTRQRLYEKNCEKQPAPPVSAGSNVGGVGAIMSPEREQWGPCATGIWGVWSECSVSCGVGVAIRQRYYLEPARAEMHSCRRSLTDRKKCRGPRMHCRAPSEYEPDPGLTAGGLCRVSPWSDWSACSARECELGVRVRTRHYLHRGATKRCHQGWNTKPIMDQTLDCFRDDHNCTFEVPEGTTVPLTSAVYLDHPTIDANVTDRNGTWGAESNGGGWEEARCGTSPWGSWSPCSAPCGHGWRMRTRFYLAPAAHPAHNVSVHRRAARLQRRLTDHLTILWNKRFAAWQNIELEDVNTTDTGDAELDERFHRQLEVCEVMLTMQDAECEGTHPHCVVKKDPSEVCGLALSVGSCRGYEARWFFDVRRRTCEPFGYTGCHGNSNNFHTRDQCLALCANYTGGPIDKASKNISNFGKVKSSEADNAAGSNSDVALNDGTDHSWRMEREDCPLTSWSGWSECTGDCSAAIKLNYRLVLRPAKQGGRVCLASLLKSRHCRPKHCRRKHRRYSTTATRNRAARRLPNFLRA